MDDEACTKGEYPEFRYNPQTVGQKKKFLTRSFVPGKISMPILS